MRRNVYEVFNEFEQTKGDDAKKAVLHRNNTPELQFVLQGAFHPNINYVIKEIPHYNPSNSPPGMAYMSMKNAMDQIYIWVEGSKKVNPRLTFEKKRLLLIQLLEAMESREAEVLCNMIMKDLGVKRLTPRLVHEAFPGLIPAPENVL